MKLKEAAQEEAELDAHTVSRLEAIYQRYVGSVYTLCLRLLSSVQAAEEASVQVFVKMNRELKKRWEEARVRERLRELAISESLTRLKVRIDRAALRIASPHVELQSRTDSPSVLDQPTLDSLTAQLPDHLRVAFVLRDREGLSDGAIASHLGIGEAEARRLIQDARLEVRRLWLGGQQESKE